MIYFVLKLLVVELIVMKKMVCITLFVIYTKYTMFTFCNFFTNYSFEKCLRQTYYLLGCSKCMDSIGLNNFFIDKI